MAMCGLMNLKATQALPMIRQLFVDKRGLGFITN
jgi:hypothetical protein